MQRCETDLSLKVRCQGPICLLAIVAVTFILHIPPGPAAKKLQTNAESYFKFREIDCLGGVLLILTVTSFIISLDFDSNNV